MKLEDLQKAFDIVKGGEAVRTDAAGEGWEASVYRLNRGDYQGQIRIDIKLAEKKEGDK